MHRSKISTITFHILPAFSQEIFSAFASNSRERFFCAWIAIENMCLGSWLSVAQTKLLTQDLGNRAEMQSNIHSIRQRLGYNFESAGAWREKVCLIAFLLYFQGHVYGDWYGLCSIRNPNTCFQWQFKRKQFRRVFLLHLNYHWKHVFGFLIEHSPDQAPYTWPWK